MESEIIVKCRRPAGGTMLKESSEYEDRYKDCD